MRDLEEEIKAWKELLDTGKINEATYDEEVSRLKKKEEKSRKYKKFETADLMKISSKVLIFIIVVSVILWIYNNNKVTKNIENVKKLSNIQNPVQVATKGKTFKIVNNTNIEINYVATYIITGRVVDVQKYFGYNTQNMLSTRDVGLSWGILAREENNRKIRWSSMGNRYLSWYSNDGKWISEMGGKEKISECTSNNHLIASDNKTQKLINIIKEGDFIRIKGYLVNVFYRKNNGSYFKWNTSTSRTDTGDGACEVIYVTDITWLKEE